MAIKSERASIAVRTVELEGHAVLRGARIEASRVRRDGGGEGRLRSITLLRGGARPGERSGVRIGVSCWVRIGT